MSSDKRTQISGVCDFRYCPYCGNELIKSEFPVRSTEIDGGVVTTKTNMEVKCKNHGVLTVMM